MSTEREVIKMLVEALEDLFNIGQVFMSAIEAKNYDSDFEGWAKNTESALAAARALPECQGKPVAVITKLPGKHAKGPSVDWMDGATVRVGMKLYTTPQPPPADVVRDAWQPIETAPKDGTVILLVGNKDNHAVAAFYLAETHDDFHWIFLDPDVDGEFLNAFSVKRFSPTHWMPLPNPPAIDAAIKGGE